MDKTELARMPNDFLKSVQALTIPIIRQSDNFLMTLKNTTSKLLASLDQ